CVAFLPQTDSPSADRLKLRWRILSLSTAPGRDDDIDTNRGSSYDPAQVRNPTPECGRSFHLRTCRFGPVVETSLHRELKECYCDDDAGREVSVGGYRIDAIVDGALIEIQQASLAALRTKTRALLETHDVVVVKPLSALKTILRLKRRNGPVASR